MLETLGVIELSVGGGLHYSFICKHFDHYPIKDKIWDEIGEGAKG